MAAAPDAMLVYDLTAAAFQGLVAALVLAAAPRDRVHQAFALLFALNAVESLDLARNTAGLGLVPIVLGDRLVDTFTVLLLAYLMAQFPAPPRSPAMRRALSAMLAAGAAAWIVVFAAGDTDPARMLPAADAVLHATPLVAAGTLLFLRAVPGYLRLDRGPLQTQVLLVTMAFGMHFFRLGFTGALDVFGPQQGVEMRVATAAQALLVLYGLWAVVRLARAALADPASRSRHVALACAILAGAGLVLADRALGSLGFGFDGGLSDVSLYLARPVLVAYAMVRFDLFRLPAAAQRALVPATAAAFLFMTFVMALQALAAFAPGGSAWPAVGALAATAGLGGLGAALAPRLGLARAHDPDRIEAYRLALERSRLEPAGPQREVSLAEARRRLRVSNDEHDLLQLLLERHVFVPAGSIAAAQPGQVLAGRYEVVRELGRGGFGRALLARDRAAAGALVAVKELLFPWMDGNAAKDPLRREFEAARGVEHPNVARSLALLDDGPQLRLVRAYVPGRTLREVVGERGPLPPEEARRIILDVLDGLAALHARGVLHLDLKPENVVLDERGRAVLIDFGAAMRAPGSEGATARLTRAAPRAGTLAWMAPEQLAGEACDARTDVFAAGALLRFLAHGKSPLPEGAYSFGVEPVVIESPSRSRRSVKRLRAVEARALDCDPARRFASVGDFRAALTASGSSTRPTR